VSEILRWAMVSANLLQSFISFGVTVCYFIFNFNLIAMEILRKSTLRFRFVAILEYEFPLTQASGMAFYVFT